MDRIWMLFCGILSILFTHPLCLRPVLILGTLPARGLDTGSGAGAGCKLRNERKSRAPSAYFWCAELAAVQVQPRLQADGASLLTYTCRLHANP